MRTLEEEFPISYYPLLQTEFLFYSKEGKFTKFVQSISSMKVVKYGAYMPNTVVSLNQKARDKYEDEKNKRFDYSMFHYRLGLLGSKLCIFNFYRRILLSEVQLEHSRYRNIIVSVYRVSSIKAVSFKLELTAWFVYFLTFCMESTELMSHW